MAALAMVDLSLDLGGHAPAPPALTPWLVGGGYSELLFPSPSPARSSRPVKPQGGAGSRSLEGFQAPRVQGPAGGSSRGAGQGASRQVKEGPAAGARPGCAIHLVWESGAGRPGRKGAAPPGPPTDPAGGAQGGTGARSRRAGRSDPGSRPPPRAPGSKMLSGKVEKRIASSVYITLAPPKRDMVSKVDTRPEVHQQRSDPPTEATKSVRTQQPQVSPPRKTPTSSHQAGQVSSSAGPFRGATGSSSAGFSTFPCPVLPDIPTGSDLESPLPSPPDPLLSSGLDALSAETLCPDLQTLNLSSPVNQQASSSTPEELRQHKIQATNLEQADERQVLKRNMNGHLERDISTVCAFCHKGLGPQTVAIEAMNKQYHVDCFRCRTCHGQLAGQHYYQKEGRPMCNACYKDTLEKCAKCQAVILDHIVRALGNGYHPECFTCSVCCRSIGDGSFALDDQNEVHCVDDFYRKYASVCGACKTPIVPQGGQDAYRIECLGRHFHETCYRCETCGVLLSPEPAENGCYPLESRIFCKSCHIKQKNESFC